MSEEPKTIDQLRQMLAIRRSELGDTHPDTLIAIDELAEESDYAWLREECLALRHEAWQARLNTLGPNDPVTIWSRTQLADAYLSDNEKEVAIAMLEQNIARARIALGNRGKETRCALKRLSEAYLMANRDEESIATAEEVYIGDVQEFGPRHRYTISSLESLAGRQYCNREFTTALKSYQEVLSYYREAHGEDHERTIVVEESIAGCYSALEEHENVVRVLESLIPRIRPENLLDTKVFWQSQWLAHSSLARSFSCLGDVDRAIATERAFIQQCERAQVSSEYMGRSMQTLCSYLFSAKRYEEAILELEKLLVFNWPGGNTVLNQDIGDRARLGRCYEQVGRLSEAEQIYERVIPIMFRTWGEENWQTQEVVQWSKGLRRKLKSAE